MNVPFISDFLDFVTYNSIQVECCYNTMSLLDAYGDEIAIIDSKGRLEVPTDKSSECCKDFAMMLLEYNVKLVPSIDEQYGVINSVDFTIDDKVCLTIPRENKIVINL